MELQGREFDWFALDAAGNLAIMATGGAGPIPASAVPYCSYYGSASEALPAPHTGSLAVWSDYAALGLYVYDWSSSAGAYELKAAPAQAPLPSLATRLTSLPGLPRLPAVFGAILTPIP